MEERVLPFCSPKPREVTWCRGQELHRDATGMTQGLELGRWSLQHPETSPP